MRKYISILSVFATLLISSLSIQQSYADSGMQLSAATGCFPRIFSQISFFKSSNGALRNNSGTPKTVVCSVHVEDAAQYHSGTIDDQLYVGVFFAFNDSLADIPCTIYRRDGDVSTGGNTALLNSTAYTVNFSGPAQKLNFMTTENIELGDYAYFQCTLPAGAAITHYNVFNL